MWAKQQKWPYYTYYMNVADGSVGIWFPLNTLMKYFSKYKTGIKYKYIKYLIQSGQGFVLVVLHGIFCSFSSSLSRDLLTKKDPEFRSIFQHIQSAQLRRSPSELFAQHVVSIVHYIKGRVWSVRPGFSESRRGSGSWRGPDHVSSV